MKKILLISTEFFPPAYRAGGPVNSVKNFVNVLKSKYEVYIITSAKDLNQKSNMELIKINNWIKKNDINIIYVDSTLKVFFNILKILLKYKVHFCYASSFFNVKFSLIIIFLASIFFVPVMIAPKGELFQGALSSKKFKKSFYIFLFKIFNYFKSVKWHATSIYEKKQIKNFFSLSERNIVICSNIVQIKIKKYIINKTKIKNKLKIIIPCRITPVKNIFRTILSLRDLRGDVVVHIFGEVDDLTYWQKCKNEILSLPKNIDVKYKGTIRSKKLFEIYPNYDVFLMPSLSENFGYSIFEALSFRLPVIIGQNNPWIGMEKIKIGFNVDPKNVKNISEKVQYYINLNENEFKIIRQNCKLYIESYIKNVNSKIKNNLLNNFF